MTQTSDLGTLGDSIIHTGRNVRRERSMPGWGTGSFENEDAQNWLAKLDHVGLDALRQIFSAAEQVDYLEAPAASVLIAAAEVVAALSGAPLEPIPPQIKKWLGNIPAVPAGLSASARLAVHGIRLNSELKDLWLQADGLNEWSASLRDLEQRLSG